MPRNALDQSTSPYLLQHKDNPVHWREWNDDAIKDAQDQNKPILLSIGYAACHWCHVMAHESFEDDETALLMNEAFINIKVDREERPDLDHIYQTALSLLGEQGGWPLTMFLTPQCQPFWGGTYFPKTPQYGRPDFKTVLSRISEVYQSKDPAIIKNANALTKSIQSHNLAQENKGPSPVGLLADFGSRFYRALDLEHGGFGSAPKFPQTQALEFLWCRGLSEDNEAYQKAAVFSAKKLCLGGIYDHLAGGFSRYCVDAQWLVPHFEKMLYDNALILDLLITLYPIDPDPVFKTAIFETIEWALRDLRLKGGSFASSFDADSDGEEGQFYVWTFEEITSLLQPGEDGFLQAYDIHQDGNWDGTTILNCLQSPENKGNFQHIKARLLRHREETRCWPSRDDKILCDWNSLMIRSLTQAADLFSQDNWRTAAENCYHDLKAGLWIDDTLFHTMRNGKTGTQGFLEDYAALALAALDLFASSGDQDYLNDAIALHALIDRYFALDNGLFAQTSFGIKNLITRPIPVYDQATPSGNALVAELLIRLSSYSEENRYRTQAKRLFTALASTMEQQSLGVPSLLNAYDLSQNAVEITVYGGGDGKVLDLIHIIWAHRPPRAIVKQIEAPNQNQSHIVVCQSQRCSLPLQKESDIIHILKTLNI